MPQFLNFPTPQGRVNLAVKIGAKYITFGTLLLEDNDGSIMEAIEKERGRNAADINAQIFRRWLRGTGRQPLTWNTLASVLQDMEFPQLATYVHTQ
jgi:hypothetical protein